MISIEFSDQHRSMMRLKLLPTKDFGGDQNELTNIIQDLAARLHFSQDISVLDPFLDSLLSRC